jgi:hypothetical protein
VAPGIERGDAGERHRHGGEQREDQVVPSIRDSRRTYFVQPPLMAPLSAKRFLSNCPTASKAWPETL